MSELFVHGWSSSDAKIPANEIFDGHFCQITNASAEHALIEPEILIWPHDYRMYERRVLEFNESVLGELRERIVDEVYEHVRVNPSGNSRIRIDGSSAGTIVPITHLSGSLWKRGHQFKKITRADEAPTKRRLEC